MRGDWRRLHQVRGVCSGSPENYNGYSVEPQNRGRRLDEELWPPRPVQLPRRGGQTAWAGQIAQAGLTTKGGGLTALAADAEMLRSGGHVSGSQGLRRG
jgi:hypothetical protein